MAWLRDSIPAAAQFAGGMVLTGFALAAGTSPAAPAVSAAVSGAGLIAAVTKGFRKVGLDSVSTLDGIRDKTLREIETRYGTAIEQFDLLAADKALGAMLPECFVDRDALAEAALHKDGFAANATRMTMAALAQKRPDVFGIDSPKAGRDLATEIVRAALAAAVDTPDYFAKLQPKLDLLEL